MPKYVIERDIPSIGDVTPDQVIAISQKSCSVLNNLGPKIQWLHSYVTQDKIYCVYIAPNEEMVREHAKQGGFPVIFMSGYTDAAALENAKIGSGAMLLHKPFSNELLAQRISEVRQNAIAPNSKSFAAHNSG